MILNNSYIEELSKKAHLVEPFNKKNLRLSSYDLTIGNEFYCEQNSSVVKTRELKQSQTFQIPPHGICFIISNEIINLPENITARVSLRMSLIYEGLMLSTQPPFDPGYSGRVIIMLHNLSSKPQNLKQGSRIATIEFFLVKRPSRTNNVIEKPDTHRSVGDLQGQLTSPVKGSLSELSRTISSYKRRAPTYLGLIIALIAIVTSAPAVVLFSYYQSERSDEKKNLDEMKKEIQKQNWQISELENQKNEKNELDNLKKELHRQSLEIADLNKKISTRQ